MLLCRIDVRVLRNRLGVFFQSFRRDKKYGQRKIKEKNDSQASSQEKEHKEKWNTLYQKYLTVKECTDNGQ